MTEPLTRRPHYIGLSVPDLDRAAAFFCVALSFKVVGSRPDYSACFVPDGQILLTLWQVANPEKAEQFFVSSFTLNTFAVLIFEGFKNKI